jgi:hypothetical protein
MSPLRLGGRAAVSRADTAVPAALVEFVRGRGQLTSAEAALCVVCWLTLTCGADAVAAREVSALYPRRALPETVPHMRSAAESLGGAVEAGLLEKAGAGAYRLTALGRAVVLALPDRQAVGALRGLTRAAPRPKAARRDGWPVP